MRIATNGDIVSLVQAGTLKPVSHQTTQVNGEERVIVTFEVVGEPTGVAVSFPSPAPAVLHRPRLELEGVTFDAETGRYIERLGRVGS